MKIPKWTILTTTYYMPKTFISWKSIWIYLKSQIEFWNLKVWLKTEIFLYHVKIYFKHGPCGVVPCACIQVYHVITLNTSAHIVLLCKYVLNNIFRWDNIFSDVNKIFKFQNSIWDFKYIQTDFQNIEVLSISLLNNYLD